MHITEGLSMPVCSAQAAVKAVQEARQAARTSSGAMPATPSLLADQPSASAASTGALPGGGPAASFSSGGAGGAVSGAGQAANGMDTDSTAKEVKSSGNGTSTLLASASVRDAGFHQAWGACVLCQC